MTAFIALLVLILHNANSAFTIAAFVVTLPIAWWLGKQYDIKKYHAERDPLTNVFNRKVIMEKSFRKLYQRCLRRREKLVVAYIDIDNFKQINDCYGHELGDLVLTRTAGILAQTAGKNDYVARWGGDEFLLLLCCKEESSVNELLQRLQRKFNAISKELDTRVSISVGLATAPNEAYLLNDLIRVAEQKMYREKVHRHFEQSRGASKKSLHFIRGLK